MSILDLIDGAIDDWTSDDSMRWSPEAPPATSSPSTPSRGLEATTRWVRAGAWIESADGRRIEIELAEGPGMPLEGNLSIECEPISDRWADAMRGWREYMPGPRIGHIDIRGLLRTGSQR